MASDILDRILERKRREVEEARSRVSEEALAEMARPPREPRSFFKRLERPGPTGVNIISEIKRASPSKGIIKENLDPAAQARAYEEGGAAALSVLTDREFFKGSPEDLKTARAACGLPALRKDFIVSEYQIYEAAAMGADAVLLIARSLSRDFMESALALCQSLSLDAMVEVHSEEELDKAGQAGARLVGVNNRDLATFKTDLNETVRLARLMTPDQVCVGESGIRTRVGIEKLAGAGVFNFLIGESLVRAEDPKILLAELMGVKS